MNYKTFAANAAANVAQNASSQNVPVMYVHDGGFHADDVLAVVLLGALFPEVEVARTRNVPEGAFAVDVGGGEYDHHTAPRPVWEKWNVPHCGASRLFVDPDFRADFQRQLGIGSAGMAWLEEHLFLPVCREDNGVPNASNNLLAFIRHANPAWGKDMGSEAMDTAFKSAVYMATGIVRVCLEQARAMDRAQEVLAGLPDEEIVGIPQGLPEWKSTLAGKTTKFVVYPGVKEDWYVQSVPPAADRVFEQKIPHPESWRGLRGADLSEASGLSGGVFCHTAGFLSVWKTEEEAWAAARHLLSQEKILHVTEDDLAQQVIKISEDDLK